MGASPSRSAKVEDSEAESQSARRARPAAPCEGAGSSAQRSSSASAGAQAAPRQGAVVAPLQQSPSKRRMSGGGFFWRSPTGDVHPADVGVFAEPALLQMHFNAGLPPKVMAGAWRPDPPPPPSNSAAEVEGRIWSALGFCALDRPIDHLEHIALRLLDSANCLNDHLIGATVLRAFVTRVRELSYELPLHNFCKAIDCMQAAWLLAQQPSASAALSRTDVLSLLLAALLHNVDHPGVSNAFVGAVDHPLARRPLPPLVPAADAAGPSAFAPPGRAPGSSDVSGPAGACESSGLQSVATGSSRATLRTVDESAEGRASRAAADALAGVPCGALERHHATLAATLLLQPETDVLCKAPKQAAQQVRTHVDALIRLTDPESHALWLRRMRALLNATQPLERADLAEHTPAPATASRFGAGTIARAAAIAETVAANLPASPVKQRRTSSNPYHATAANPGLLGALIRDGQTVAALSVLLKAAELAPGFRSPLVHERWAARRAAEARRQWKLEGARGLPRTAHFDPARRWAIEEAKHLREVVLPTLEILVLCVPEAGGLVSHCEAHASHWDIVANKPLDESGVTKGERRAAARAHAAGEAGGGANRVAKGRRGKRASAGADSAPRRSDPARTSRGGGEAGTPTDSVHLPTAAGGGRMPAGINLTRRASVKPPQLPADATSAILARRGSFKQPQLQQDAASELLHRRGSAKPPQAACGGSGTVRTPGRRPSAKETWRITTDAILEVGARPAL